MWLDGNDERTHCYDITGPFTLAIQRWRCTVHSRSINDLVFLQSLEPAMLDDVITLFEVNGKQDRTHLLILSKTLITFTLYQDIVSLYKQTFNVKRIKQTLSIRWMTSVRYLIWQVRWS